MNYKFTIMKNKLKQIHQEIIQKRVKNLRCKMDITGNNNKRN